MMISRYYIPFTAIRPDDGSNFDATPDGTPLGVFKGLLQPVGSSENFSHFKTDDKITHRLYTGVMTQLEYGDIITYAGVQYTIIGPLQPTGISGMNGISLNSHKEILVGTRGEGRS